MDERTRPARDLLAQVRLTAPRRIVDMGCGPGNSTELLVARYPDAAITGLDNSPAMLAAARKALPALTFSEADAATWVPDAGVDLVFANAIYQWVPEHLEVLRRLLAAMGAGGCLAVQMPDNLAEPTHRLMIETARSGPWADRLASTARAPLPPVRAYYDALRPYAAHLDIWHSVYNHVLDGPAAVVDWVRGTGLRPFLEPLSPGEQVDFLARYTDAIAAAYPAAADGKVLLRFPRLFIVATRGP
jgi:trans-aconitate 2-methyltransferase